MYLTREAFLEAQDIEVEEVLVPALGGKVRVKVMTCVERAIWDNGISSTNNGDGSIPKDLRSLLASLTAVDQDGKRLFSAEDAEALAQKSYLLIEPIVDVALRINQLLPKAVEQGKKNSSGTPASDSSTD